jgi:hypothetical protein
MSTALEFWLWHSFGDGGVAACLLVRCCGFCDDSVRMVLMLLMSFCRTWQACW